MSSLGSRLPALLLLLLLIVGRIYPCFGFPVRAPAKRIRIWSAIGDPAKRRQSTTSLAAASTPLLDDGSPSSSLDTVMNSVSRHFQSLGSVENIQKDLVRRAVSFTELECHEDLTTTTTLMGEEDRLLVSPTVKVPGCVANVHIRTVLIPQEHHRGQYYTVRLEGTADALVSRGLLAILAAILAGHAAEHVVSVSPRHLAQRLGLGNALSPGRNNGLASMLRTVQDQIHQLLSSTNNGSMKQDDATAATEPITNRPPSVALLLSGGVDSSVALNLLKRDGYNVTAFYLKIWLEDELAHLGQCPWEDDYRMCQAVCQQANVPLESISLQQAYKDRVISYTVQEAEHGRTPNPDIMCNSRVKFGCFYDAIRERDFDFVATGHYAQVIRGNDATQQVRLIRAPDAVKDQSYFLCALTQEQLQRVLFPIGHLEKSAVRQLAHDFQLPNRHRPDSQGLCFLGKVKFDEFLSAYLGERPGDIVDAATGDLLGRHRGVWYHTVGQRKGIGKVLDPVATSRGPWYVVAKDPVRNTVFCSNQYDEEMFESSRSEFTVESIHWIAGSPPAFVQKDIAKLTMKIRHGPRLVNGTLTLSDDTGLSGDVRLQHKDGGLAPGQYVVFYEGTECLGGGVISERHWAKFLLERKETSRSLRATCNATSKV